MTVRKWLIAIPAAIVVVFLLSIIFRFESIRWLYSGIGMWLSLNLGLDDQYVTFAAIALTALSVPLISLLVPMFLLGRRSGQAVAVVLGVTAVAFGLLFFFGGEVFFTEDGEPLRCWAMTPDGIKVAARSSDTRECGVDRTYNVQYQPITQEIAPSILAGRRGISPVRVEPGRVEKIGYFDITTGRPNIWYQEVGEGVYDLFTGPGFHPTSQKPLLPVTQSNVQHIDKYVRANRGRTNTQSASPSDAAQSSPLIQRVLPSPDGSPEATLVGEVTHVWGPLIEDVRPGDIAHVSYAFDSASEDLIPDDPTKGLYQGRHTPDTLKVFFERSGVSVEFGGCDDGCAVQTFNDVRESNSIGADQVSVRSNSPLNISKLKSGSPSYLEIGLQGDSRFMQSDAIPRGNIDNFGEINLLITLDPDGDPGRRMRSQVRIARLNARP